MDDQSTETPEPAETTEQNDQQSEQAGTTEPAETTPEPTEQQTQEPQADPDDQSGLETALPDQPIERTDPEPSGPVDHRDIRAEVEGEYSKVCRQLELAAQEAHSKIDETMRNARREARENRDRAFAEAGLDGQGNPPPVERKKPDYFNRHRVTAPVV